MKDTKQSRENKSLLRSLLAKDVHTVKELCEASSLSDKTVRLRLNDLNAYLTNNDLGRITKKPRVGVWLSQSDEQRMQLITAIQDEVVSDSTDSEQTRFLSILRTILKNANREEITAQELADEIYLSVPTTTRIIKNCAIWLSQFNVECISVRNKGIVLNCNEEQYRIALKHSVVGQTGNFEELIDYYFPGVSQELIKDAILKTEKEWNLAFAEESFQEVFLYLSVAVYRNLLKISDEIIYDKSEMNRLTTYSEYSFSRSLFLHIEEVFQMSFPEEEVAFLSVQLLCSKLIDTNYVRSTQDLLRRYDDRLFEFVTKVIEVVSDVLNIPLSDDDLLIRGLLLHLRPVIFRLRFEKKHDNRLIQEIKEEYSLTFRVSWLISMLFEQYYGLQVTEDEIGYIAIYIQSAVERNRKNFHAILLTRQGMGMTQLLVEQIKGASPFVEDIEVVSLHDFEIHKYPDKNLIFTTVSLDIDDPRIIVVESFIREEMISELNKVIRKKIEQIAPSPFRFNPECHSFFEPSLMFTNLHYDDKFSLLSYLCKQLKSKGYVTSKFEESVIERERNTSTAVGDMTAIPHGDQETINEPKVVIATLDEAIDWDGTPVRIVCLLAIKMKTPVDAKKTQQFYKEFVRLIESEEDIEKLLSFNSSIDLYKYFIK